MSHHHFKNEKLFLLYSDECYHIKHNLKITHIVALGRQLCFSDEKNEIFEVAECGSYNGNISNGIIPSNTKIKFLIAGYDDIYVVLENNKIFSSHYHEKFKEVTITTIENITHACCGTYCGIFVDKYKYIHTMGRITHDCEINCRKSFTFNCGTIKKISCGYGHLIILNSYDEIYGLGNNDYNQLTPSRNEVNSLIKICPTFIQDSIIVDAFALPLSHLTVVVTNKNDIFIYGNYNVKLERCFRNANDFNSEPIKLKHSCFKKDEGELDCKTAYEISELDNDVIEDDTKFNYEKKEISIYGGFTTMAFVNNIKNKIWLGGWSGYHFQSVNLKKISDDFRGEERVIDISCGSEVIGILVAHSSSFESSFPFG